LTFLACRSLQWADAAEIITYLSDEPALQFYYSDFPKSMAGIFPSNSEIKLFYIYNFQLTIY